MALHKTITLANGVELTYHVISLAENVLRDFIRVTLHGFTGKSYFNKAIKKEALLLEQNSLIKDFEALMEKEEKTEDDDKELANLQTKINDLADKIENTKDYENYILGETTINIPFTEDLSIENLENELVKTEYFKSAKIVK